MSRRVADGTRLWNGLRISLGFATLRWSDEMSLLALRSRLSINKNAPLSIHIVFHYFKTGHPCYEQYRAYHMSSKHTGITNRFSTCYAKSVWRLLNISKGSRSLTTYRYIFSLLPVRNWYHDVLVMDFGKWPLLCPLSTSQTMLDTTFTRSKKNGAILQATRTENAIGYGRVDFPTDSRFLSCHL